MASWVCQETTHSISYLAHTTILDHSTLRNFMKLVQLMLTSFLSTSSSQVKIPGSTLVSLILPTKRMALSSLRHSCLTLTSSGASTTLVLLSVRSAIHSPMNRPLTTQSLSRTTQCMRSSIRVPQRWCFHHYTTSPLSTRFSNMLVSQTGLSHRVLLSVPAMLNCPPYGSSLIMLGSKLDQLTTSGTLMATTIAAFFSFCLPACPCTS